LSLSSQKYGFGIRGLESGIRKKPIPDPGSRGQKGTGSGSVTLQISIGKVLYHNCEEYEEFPSTLDKLYIPERKRNFSL
jgi:hypothetical protein